MERETDPLKTHPRSKTEREKPKLDRNALIAGDAEIPPEFPDATSLLFHVYSGLSQVNLSAYKAALLVRGGTNGNIPLDDLLEMYLADTPQPGLLSPHEELELGKIIFAGNIAQRLLKARRLFDSKAIAASRAIVKHSRDARTVLVLDNIPLAVAFAKKYEGQGVPFIDLIQEGNLGLIRASKTYNGFKGNRFSTYAVWWIRQIVLRAVGNNNSTIRVPIHAGDTIRGLYKSTSHLQQELHREPTTEEIAKSADMNPAKVKFLLEASRFPLSLNDPVGNNRSEELGDRFEDKTSKSPPEAVAAILLSERVNEILARLSPREELVLRLYYGFDGKGTQTLEEIGKRMGTSREWVGIIFRGALKRLRHPLYWRILKDWL